MNSVEIASVSDENGRQSSRPVWQEEIKQLHVNFFVLDALIHQPAGLCHQMIDRYAALQKTIADTLEVLLEELERIDSRKLGSYAPCNQLLKQHALIMRQLNARVDTLVNAVKD